MAAMTDLESFSLELFRARLAPKSLRWDPQRREAAWRSGVLDKVLDVIQKSATRAARRAPHDTSCDDISDSCTEAHDELHLRLFTLSTALRKITNWIAT